MNTLDQAALTNLFGAGMPTPSKWYPPSDATLDHHQQWVNKMRAWADTLEDRAIRRAHIKWIDHTQRQIAECREENRTHAEQQKSDAMRERFDAEARQVQDFAETLPTPPR